MNIPNWYGDLYYGTAKYYKMCCAGVAAWNIYDERPIVTVESENELEKRLIMDHLKLKYADFQLPDDILLWNHIPVGATRKKQLREMLYYHFRCSVPFFYVDSCESVHLDLWQNAIFIEPPKHGKRQMVQTVET